MSSMATAIVKHPEMHRPGLNSSIVETVSVTFAGGQTTEPTVIGELALAYHPVDASAQTSSQGIRLENFAVLEKVAPNPAIVTQVPDKSGEYYLNLSSLNRTTVAFKYIVHLDETTTVKHVPIFITPAWKVEAKQTSVILTYAVNPSFGALEDTAITLSNVIIVIKLAGVKASTCQSKPVGNFSKEKSLIYWRLGDLTLRSDEVPKKLLARFMTESEATPGQVQARWEMTGGQNDPARLGSGLALSQMTSLGPSPGTAADPFADESAAAGSNAGWKEVPTARRLVSGAYMA